MKGCGTVTTTASTESKIRKVWIFSGEASGDLYGSRLAKSLWEKAEAEGYKLEISGMGGPKMQSVGIPVKVDSTELGVVGIWEVVKHLFTFAGIFRRLQKSLAEERPDAVVMIDYPTFNLMMAKRAWKLNIPVIWYVSPQVWVWHKKRIYKLAKYCKKMLVIFPFEEEVYAPTTLKAEFVGHPMLDIVRERLNPELKRDMNQVLLLPGSRTMEVSRLFPAMLETVKVLHEKYPQLYFVAALPREKMLNLSRKIYEDFQKKHPGCTLPLELVCGQTGKYLQTAMGGIAASGSVTVEAAISNLPLVVGYKLSWITLAIFLMIAKLFRGFFTMVNIIENKMVYEEFLQYQVSPPYLVPAFERIMPDGARRAEVEQSMVHMQQQLSSGNMRANEKAAAAVWEVLQ